MTGNEDVFDHQRVAAGGFEADDMPVVANLVVTPRHEEAAEVHRPAVLDHRAADERPVGVVTSGRPQPGAVDQVAAVYHHPGAHRRIGRRHPHRRIVSPDVLLGPLVELRQVPVVHTQDSAGPPGGSAGAGDPSNRFEEQRGVRLKTAPLLGLEEFEESGLIEIGDVGIREPAQQLGFRGPFAQPRKKVVDGRQDRLGVALLNGRHCKPPECA